MNIPISSSGNALWGHIFEPQYDGYLKDREWGTNRSITTAMFCISNISMLKQTKDEYNTQLWKAKSYISYQPPSPHINNLLHDHIKSNATIGQS